MLTVNINAFEVYNLYIRVLLWYEAYKEVESFIDFVLKVKGSSKTIETLKLAHVYAFNKEIIEFFKSEKEHIKTKSFIKDDSVKDKETEAPN